MITTSAKIQSIPQFGVLVPGNIDKNGQSIGISSGTERRSKNITKSKEERKPR